MGPSWLVDETAVRAASEFRGTLSAAHEGSKAARRVKGDTVDVQQECAIDAHEPPRCAITDSESDPTCDLMMSVQIGTSTR